MIAPPVLDDAPPLICHRADPRDAMSLDLSWWLVHARSRQEKALSADLIARDVPHLLPLYRNEHVTPSGNRVASVLPLFPGYLFLCGDQFDRLNALSTGSRRIVGTIPVFDVAGLVSDLGRLMDAIESGATFGPARTLAPGSRVRVASGPMEGTEGTLVRESHRDLLLLHVRALGQVVPCEVERWRVESIDGA